MLRNNASEPEIGLPGRISAGLQSEKHHNRPPAGRRPAGGPISRLFRLVRPSKHVSATACYVRQSPDAHVTQPPLRRYPAHRHPLLFSPGHPSGGRTGAQPKLAGLRPNSLAHLLVGATFQGVAGPSCVHVLCSLKGRRTIK